jgi:hypothetical protein
MGLYVFRKPSRLIGCYWATYRLRIYPVAAVQLGEWGFVCWIGPRAVGVNPGFALRAQIDAASDALVEVLFAQHQTAMHETYN